MSEVESMKSFRSYCDFFPSKILSPNLIELEWTGEISYDFLPLLLSPHLRKIKIDVMGNEVSKEGRTQLLNVIEKVPRLESFHIGGFFRHQSSLKLTQVLLKGLQPRSLGLLGYSISMGDLSLIRSLPNLEGLSLNMDYSDPDGISDRLGPLLVEGLSPGSPELHDLTVSCSIQRAIQLIKHLGARPQRNITPGYRMKIFLPYRSMLISLVPLTPFVMGSPA
ncbi:hypothetical protein FRC03_004338 [Tulasnella sp. 419]|nr:hypothetical protein FRC03_004338 [Tulasnella sp. 419]